MLHLIYSGMNVLPAGLEPFRERLKGFRERLDQCLVLAVGITVQELLDTAELCQVSAPTVELQQFGQEY